MKLPKPKINIWRDGYWNNIIGYTPKQVKKILKKFKRKLLNEKN